MSTPVAGLPYGRELTVDDLESLPDDGHRYELLDGMLVVTPAPIWDHQAAQFELHRLLDECCPEGFQVVGAPFEWRGSERTALQPDILVTRSSALHAVPGRKFLAEPPLLAVEVLSPSTRRFDRLSKMSAYEDAGVGSYWLVDPDLDRPSLTALDLVDGRYVETAVVVGAQSWTAERPYPVTVVPADLLRALRD